MESPINSHASPSLPNLVPSNISTSTEQFSASSINASYGNNVPIDLQTFPEQSSSPLIEQKAQEAQQAPRSWHLRTFQPMSAGSLRGSVFLLVNSALGAGLLTLPYAMSLSGVIFASILITVHGLVAAYTAYILSITIANYGRGTYSEISQWVLGSKWAFAVDTLITLNGVGMCMTLFVFLGDFLPQSLEPFNLPAILHDRRFLLTISLIIMWPIAVQRYLGPLKLLSFSIIISLLIVLVFVIYKMVPLYFEASQKYDINYFSFNWSFFNYYTVILFSYSQHMSVCPIIEELHDKTPQRIFKVVARAFTVEYFLYLSYAIFGYFSWLGGTHQNFMTNYPVNDYLILSCRILISFMLIVTLPLNIIAACRSFILLRLKLFKLTHRMENSPITFTNDSAEAHEETNLYRNLEAINVEDRQDVEHIQTPYEEIANPSKFYITRIVGSTLILLSGYIVAIITDKVAIVVGYMGGTVANSLVLLFPSFLFLYGPVSKNFSPFLKYSIFGFLILMSITGYIGTIAQIFQVIGLLPKFF